MKIEVDIDNAGIAKPEKNEPSYIVIFTPDVEANDHRDPEDFITGIKEMTEEIQGAYLEHFDGHFKVMGYCRDDMYIPTDNVNWEN